MASPLATSSKNFHASDGVTHIQNGHPTQTLSQSSSSEGTRRHIIQVDDILLLKLPSGHVKQVKCSPTITVNLGKFGSFPCSQLIGQYYGLTFEVVYDPETEDKVSINGKGTPEGVAGIIGDDVEMRAESEAEGQEAKAADQEGDKEEAAPKAEGKDDAKNVKGKKNGQGSKKTQEDGKAKSDRSSKGKGKGKEVNVDTKKVGWIKRYVGRTATEEIDVDDIEATNEFIVSQGAQRLSMEDIEAFKKKGMTGKEIIQKQMEENSSFELKTAFSRDKYLKRKEQKFLQHFTVLEPTLSNIATYVFEQTQPLGVPKRDQAMRIDTLCEMLSYGNVGPSWSPEEQRIVRTAEDEVTRTERKILIVEDMKGLVAGACMERIDGTSHILLLTDVDSPPDLGHLPMFNFSPSMTTHKRDGDDVLRYMSWAATQEDWRPPELPMGEELQDAVIGEIAAGDKEAGKDVPGTVSDELDLESKRPKLEKVPKKGEPSLDPDLTTKSTPTEPDASDAKTGITEPAHDAASNNAMSKLARRNKFRMEREQERLRKRRATYDALAQARKMYFEGEFETLLIACPYEPWSIVEKVLPYLAGSAQIVIYSPYLQILSEALPKFRQSPSFVNSSIFEPMLRRYQVLPGRTHPEMQGMPSGGYLLVATRVFDDVRAKGFLQRPHKDKRRRDEGTPVTDVAASQAEKDA